MLNKPLIKTNFGLPGCGWCLSLFFFIFVITKTPPVNLQGNVSITSGQTINSLLIFRAEDMVDD